jgi:hypothetical protein
MAVAGLTGHGDPDILRLLPATISPDRVALVGLHEWTDDDFGNVAAWGIHTFTLYKSVGLAVQDPAAVALVLTVARQRGVGAEITL